MKQRPQHIIIALLFLCLGFTKTSYTQVNPVSANFTIAPPSSVYLSDYTIPGSQKLTLNINLNDENQDFLDVFLDVKIEGNGVSLRTNPDFNYEPISIETGINMLSGSEIEQYLNPANMIIDGLDPEEFIMTSVLPEGMYSFCVTVRDYLRRDKVLSYESCNVSTLLRNNPPTNISPICDQSVVVSGIQNVQFQWQANHDNSIMAEYSLKIVEVLPGVNANDAMNGANTPIVEGLTTNMNQFLYGPDQPDLEIGHTYAYRIDVEDMEGLTTFENEGIGEVCVFEYGYEVGGTIGLTSPLEGGSLKGNTSTIFQWTGPSNASPGDNIYYRFKVVEVQDGQDPQEAMLNNGLRIDDQTDIISNISNYNYLLEEELGMENRFAWQVEAYLGDQKVAESAVRSFGTSPFIDHISAGGRRIEVLSLNNSDLESLSGRGTMMLQEEGEPTVVNFENLKVAMYPSGNFLEEGTMISPIEGNLVLDLENEDGLESTFTGTHIVLDSRELRIRGTVEWTFPLPALTDGDQIATVRTKEMDVDYGTFKIRESIPIDPTSFTLLDPYGYSLHIEDGSIMNVIDNSMDINLNGKVVLPSSIRTKSGNALEVPFDGVIDLEYFQTKDLSLEDEIYIFENDKVSLTPLSIAFDFSGEMTPGILNGETEWKGAYFDKFDINFPIDFDASEQLKRKEKWSRSFTDEGGQYYSWIHGNELTVKADQVFDANNSGARFNTFSGDLKEWKIILEEGTVEDSYFKGEIKIPLLGDAVYSYTIPYNNDGLATGILDELLDNEEIVFMPGDSTREMRLTINQASFKDKEYLECAATTTWTFLEATNNGPIEGVYDTNLKIWGDGNIGYGRKDGEVALNNTARGRLGGSFRLTTDTIGAGVLDNEYVFWLKLAINLGNQIAGERGVSRSVFATTRALNDEIVIPRPAGSVALAGKIGSYAEGIVQIPDLLVYVPGLLRIQSGKISFTIGHEKWGNSFRGNISVDIYKPKKVNLNANVVIGHNPTSDIAFFFGEIGVGQVSMKDFEEETIGDDARDNNYRSVKDYANGPISDEKGQSFSIKLGPAEITALRLKFLLNLEYNQDSKGNQVLEPVAAGNNSWGFGGYIALQVDGGKKFKGDLGGMGFAKNGNLSTLEFQATGEVVEKVEYNASVLLMFDEQRYLFTGGFKMEEPLCVEAQLWGDMDFANNKFVFDLGKKSQKITIVQPSCVGIGGEGWIHFAYDQNVMSNGKTLDSIGIELGLGFAARLQKKSPWIIVVPEILEFRPVLDAKFGIGAFGNISVEWEQNSDPTFYCRNVGIYVNASAAVSIDYNSTDGGGSFEIASVSIGGELKMTFIPEPWTLSGSVKGTAKVLGIEASLEFSFKDFVVQPESMQDI